LLRAYATSPPDGRPQGATATKKRERRPAGNGTALESGTWSTAKAKRIGHNKQAQSARVLQVSREFLDRLVEKAHRAKGRAA
jgi:hypothetical protein